jgi:hypothetical protein
MRPDSGSRRSVVPSKALSVIALRTSGGTPVAASTAAHWFGDSTFRHNGRAWVGSSSTRATVPGGSSNRAAVASSQESIDSPGTGATLEGSLRAVIAAVSCGSESRPRRSHEVATPLARECERSLADATPASGANQSTQPTNTALTSRLGLRAPFRPGVCQVVKQSCRLANLRCISTRGRSGGGGGCTFSNPVSHHDLLFFREPPRVVHCRI